MEATLESPLELFTADIDNIASLVFGTMLGLEIEADDRDWRPCDEHITAAVYFGGDWQGGLLVECGRAVARGVTERLMNIPPDSQTNDDLLDAMGELANQLGGNMKSLMPRGVTLSIPAVVDGSDYSMRLCGGQRARRRSFRCHFGHFWITIVEVALRDRR